MGWIKNENLLDSSFSEHGAVFFKNNDGLGFMLRGKVKHVSSDDVIALIDGVYSLDGTGRVISGKEYEKYINKEIRMSVSFTHIDH